MAERYTHQYGPWHITAEYNDATAIKRTSRARTPEGLETRNSQGESQACASAGKSVRTVEEGGTGRRDNRPRVRRFVGQSDLGPDTYTDPPPDTTFRP